SMKRRGFNGGNDRAYVGKLPKAQAGSPFPTTLSRGPTFTPGSPDLPADFYPWIGVDLPVGQPVGTYDNPNVRLREPSPNRQVVVQNGAATIVPPDRIGNPDPNAQMNDAQDPVDKLPNGGLGVFHPIASATTLNLSADIEESEPAIATLEPAAFNATGFTQAGTLNDPIGNDDSPAMVVQSLPGSGITTNATAMFLYWSSDRGQNPPGSAPATLYGAKLTIPYDEATGTFASTFGTDASALWNTVTALDPNAVSDGVIPTPSALPPGMNSNPPAYVTWNDSAGYLHGQNLSTGAAAVRLLPPSPYTQGPRLVLDNLNRYDESANLQQLLGVVAFGDLAGRYTLDYTPLNTQTGAPLPPYPLITPSALTNPRDPSTMHMIGAPTTYLEPAGTEVQYGTPSEDYEAIGYVGTSRTDRRTSIYANRYIRTASPPNGPVISRLDPAGAAWPRVGLSVPLRFANPGDPLYGETLLKDTSGLIYSSRNLGWLTPMPPVPPNLPQPYPAYAANPDYFRDWPQVMIFDAASHAFVSALTPPLAPNTWLYDSKNQIWLLQDPAKKLLLTMDANNGQVTLAAPLPALANGDAAELHADYTPLTMRLTNSAQADASPVILMDDSPDNLAHIIQSSGGVNRWATVARHTMLVVFRRNGAQGNNPASTLFYTAYRLEVELPANLLINPATNLPDIQVYSAPGGVVGAIIPANHWGIDFANNSIWFDSSVENADIRVTMNTTGPNPVSFNTTVGWKQVRANGHQIEDPVRIQGIVNEGQPNAFIETVAIPLVDPTFSLPLDANGQPTTANTAPFIYTYSKLWIFWSSTRTGTGGPNARPNTDLLYESIVPQF
ncbi:MAG TPA: hypothetical protein VFJ58_22255, partial [Armatimonadota bacterium]|nr:hypothetical protein [Armatimonadota bacterium]